MFGWLKRLKRLESNVMSLQDWRNRNRSPEAYYLAVPYAGEPSVAYVCSESAKNFEQSYMSKYKYVPIQEAIASIAVELGLQCERGTPDKIIATKKRAK
jgi:hypothetical protein